MTYETISEQIEAATIATAISTWEWDCLNEIKDQLLAEWFGLTEGGPTYKEAFDQAFNKDNFRVVGAIIKDKCERWSECDNHDLR